MNSNRNIDFIIIASFLTLTLLYILKVSWSGFLLYLFSLLISSWLLINEFRKKTWSVNKIVLITLLLLTMGLALQALLTSANNLLAICVTLTMYTFLAERFKTLSPTKKS